MFCPKCAEQNLDNAKFCRACGTNVSLVPQALTGQLTERHADDDEGNRARRRRQRHEEKPSVERAVQSLFMGIAFIFVAFAVRSWAPGGGFWWFWMFLPAAGLLAKGVGTFMRLREDQKKLDASASSSVRETLSPPLHASALPPRSRHTDELIEPPPSVTEATTRHLGVPVERKPKDV